MSFPTDLDMINHDINQLFLHLMNDLTPMEKPGPMSGRCELQTSQMETFLKENFDFENIPDEYIVQGVRSFRVGRLPSLESIDENLIIKFPSETYENPFEMTIGEIRKWQQSYVVYACQDNDLSIDKEFLQQALKGQSKDGDEAFRMKFVIRMSTCPILMEFDGQVIPRKLEKTWPNRIKLVSVTGIDFAGRKHDIQDIYTYLTNWKDVYALDPCTNQPLVYGGRDFFPNRNVRGVLDEKRLYNDLIRMARLRLRACDYQGVQIVVETGIGLGVFAGRQIGIDDKTRSFTARAIKQVIEEDGSKYTNIRAIVFALPIFEIDESTSTYNCFIDIFNNGYSGSIPILIVDQDMHRLTVAIAKRGFFVSELNPADSHGVFGEYWQNRGPAVEEKLALTTVGLLVQHHLFNEKHVLNSDNYNFMPIDDNLSVNTVVSTPTSYINVGQLLQSLQETVGRIGTWIIWILFLFRRKRDDDHIV
ncbi:unnamed protein product [Rotaria sordida]|uniref:Uncharacterized protein n=1 Tax=Rotaria sordida TaxID=392033 RepID=A0A819C226_9BILA|nr:unnamed protein product [Rotaria sordida]CAF3811937.1 unnamed protein product [Rotaria sordida]